jgi:hypothetical protein
MKINETNPKSFLGYFSDVISNQSTGRINETQLSFLTDKEDNRRSLGSYLGFVDLCARKREGMGSFLCSLRHLVCSQQPGFKRLCNTWDRTIILGKVRH